MTQAVSKQRRLWDVLVLGMRRMRVNRELIVLVSIGIVLTVLLIRASRMSDNHPGDAEHVAKILAIFGGGLWVLYQFVLRRAFESALVMSIAVRTNPMEAAQYAVYFEIELANVGGRRIVCAKRLLPKQIEDYEGSIRYPCDLQVRSLARIERSGPHVDWWRRQEQQFPPVSLLAEYSTADEAIDFFMEPGEKYMLGHVLVLGPGHYMAKIVFVGSRSGAAEYWSRMRYFHVPESSQTPSV